MVELEMTNEGEKVLNKICIFDCCLLCVKPPQVNVVCNVTTQSPILYVSVFFS